MLTTNIIRVAEYEKLFYHEEKPFKQQHWEALCRYLENTDKPDSTQPEYYKILNRGIQFLNYVGVIQAGNLTIEVLPKTDRGSTTAANETIEQHTDATKQKWHGALLDMLKECRLLQVNHVDYASLKLRSNSILDIYLELFLVEAERLLHEGLLKKYQKQEGNQSALKGQLLFQKQLTQNSTHAERFYVRHTEYNRDTIFNRILYKTIKLIAQITHSPHLLDKANSLLLLFPPMSSITATPALFDRLTYDRKSNRYQEAVQIARMLLLNYRPDITGGSENVMAILFDMNQLWEEWVYRRLKKEEVHFNLTVQRQQSRDFWKGEHLHRPKTIRPDIVIQQNDRTIIVDTKWKLVQNMTPADEDLKQMFVYNLYWQCSESILLYPATEDMDQQSGDYVTLPANNHQTGRCHIMTQHIFSEEKLDGNFGSKLLERMNATASHQQL